MNQLPLALEPFCGGQRIIVCAERNFEARAPIGNDAASAVPEL